MTFNLFSLRKHLCTLHSSTPQSTTRPARKGPLRAELEPMVGSATGCAVTVDTLLFPVHMALLPVLALTPKGKQQLTTTRNKQAQCVTVRVFTRTTGAPSAN